MAVPGAGYVARCGIGIESTWGTLVAPAELLPFINTDIKQTVELADGESLIGKAGYEDIKDVIKIDSAGSIECYADYQALDKLFALVLGGTIVKTGASAPYTHKIPLGEDIGRSLSVALDKGVEDFYVAGLRVNALEFNSSPDGVNVSIDTSAKIITRGTTHHAALVALSFTMGRRVYHHHAIFRIADCTDALAANDAKAISEFVLRVENTLKTDERTTTSGKYINSQIRSGKRIATLSFTLPRFESNEFFGWLDSETKLQADMIYTGPVCGSGNYTLKFELPTLKISACSADISDPGLFPNVVECECRRNNGNTNMASITEEFLTTLLNERSADIWS